ncbi:MAG: 2Fe-2S iron-sulfur cluster-binding protein [Clostridia bacterium]
MKIIFDNQEMNVENENDNIVEIAQKHGINIIAPCFRNKGKFGGCGACLIEVEGEKVFACGTKPYDGMKIVYDRQDLETIRQERLQEYADNIKWGTTENNTCTKYGNGSCGSGDGCGCGGNCGC